MDDDFVLNFATSNPATATKLGKQKGGRWTDRARDKRRVETVVKKQSKGTSSSSNGSNYNNGGDSVEPKGSINLGKRDREDASTSNSNSNSNLVRARPVYDGDGGVSSSNGAGVAGSPVMIQPRQNRLNSGATSSSTTSAGTNNGAGDRGGPINKNVLGPGGKKQYISSLFTADGLPVTSTKASTAPIIPSRPSNAPLRAPIEEEEEEVAEKLEEGPVASTSTIPEAIPLVKAPALAALGLNAQLVSHLAGKLSITGPTACQAGAIPPLLSGTLPISSKNPSSARARDAILQAQTGSGKTLAFLLPLLQDLLTLHPNLFNSNEPPSRSVGTLAIILAPTRELAAQIYSVLESILSLPSPSSTTTFTVPPRALTPCLLVGGANRTHEKSRLRKGCPIIVATPGRLLDHLRTTESFRLAGEPIPTKGPRGRGAGIPGTGANYGALGRDRGNGKSGRALGLRWLVVDECDRLMDLGFEEQMKGILEELERRSPSAGLESEEGRRRTVLCSATASEGVDRLAGMALHEPVTLRASTAGGMVIPVTPVERSTATTTTTTLSTGEIIDSTELALIKEEEKISFTPPTQLVHNYVVCPPKLRFVALVALLRRILASPAAKKGPGSKILVFLSSTDAVNFYWEAMGSMGMGSTPAVTPKTNVLESAKDKSERLAAEELASNNKLASESPLLPGVPIYRLHGNLELAKRLGSLKAFSGRTTVEKGKEKGKETENAVLLCTSVAARGLDVPFVAHVVQYDLPTEGGVTEYIHRVGRTARAGASGQATAFILPTESTWVPWVESGMRDGAEKRGVKDVKLREIGIEDILKDGFGGEGREYETRATDVQMGFERWVSENEDQSTLARNAFASHVRAYATHPHSEKSMFNTKSLHLGHLAKSFGMRDAPSHTSGSNSTSKKSAGGKRVKSTGRTTTVRTLGAPQSDRERADRAIASLPARVTRDNNAGGFETGRRHNEERAMKRQKDQMMKGPSDNAGEFQVASTAMLESLASGKRKR